MTNDFYSYIDIYSVCDRKNENHLSLLTTHNLQYRHTVKYILQGMWQYRVSKKNDAFHIQISRELIAGICLFPCVQPT